MSIYRCKIEIIQPSGDTEKADFAINSNFAMALEWIALAGLKDSRDGEVCPCISIEHTNNEVTLRVNRNLASEVATARRVG